MADQVDEMFRKKTGITRRLDPAKDRELMRTWLRIRDELMERRIGGATASSRIPGPYAGKGLLITGSVGKGAHNYEPDVIVVKSLLNELAEDLLYSLEEQWLEQPDGSKAMEVVTLALTGRVGPSTIERIERFQQRIVGLTNPDGRIDPGNKTLNELLRYVLHSGEVVPLRTLDGHINPSQRCASGRDRRWLRA